jgi:hypothetical protein
LCCNTNKGKLVVWREVKPKDGALGTRDDEDRWEWCSTFPISSATKTAKWCQNVPDLLAINAVRDIFVLRQQEICATYNEKVIMLLERGLAGFNGLDIHSIGQHHANARNPTLRPHVRR